MILVINSLSDLLVFYLLIFIYAYTYDLHNLHNLYRSYSSMLFSPGITVDSYLLTS